MSNPSTQSGRQPLGGAGRRPHRSDSHAAQVAFWPLVLLFTGVDTVLILGAMTVVLANGTPVAIFASISVALLAAVLAHEAGRQAREASIWSKRPAAAITLLLLFAAVVLGLTYIRWNAGELTSTTIGY